LIILVKFIEADEGFSSRLIMRLC